MNRNLPFAAATLTVALFSVPCLAEMPGETSEVITAKDLASEWTVPAFWEMSAEDFLAAYDGLGFQRVPGAQNEFRAASPVLRFAGLPVLESAVRLGAEGAASLSLYNRGDSGDLSRDKFTARVAEARDALVAHFGAEPEPVQRNLQSAVSLDGFVWVSDACRATLEWSFTREMRSRNIPFRAEFIRLRIEPPEVARGLLEQAMRERELAAAPTDTRREPERRDGGDVILEGIPMIDQGEKGYCVVATAERVMRYYGREVDQHELAQIADSSAKEGTSTEAMAAALKSVSARMKIRFRTHYDFDFNSFRGLVRDYNTLARRAKEKQIDLERGIIHVGEIYRQFDPIVLEEARAKSRTAFSRFQSDIQKYIGDGTPLLWTLMLGIVPEGGRSQQTFGGHMRLIIGFNEETEELLYSDSWGPGHEEKRMPLKDAWTATTGLFTIEPF